MGYADADIMMSIKPTGASRQTAQQDNLGCSGVQASNAMAQTDLDRMNNYITSSKEKLRYIISRVGQREGVDAAIIAGIISRESRAGNTIAHTGGWGDNYNGFGLMQVDKRSHTPIGAWDGEEHLTQATRILVGIIGEMQTRWSGLSEQKQFMGALAYYNMGPPTSYEQVDAKTTGRDYSNDVVARAQWYKRQGY